MAEKKIDIRFANVDELDKVIACDTQLQDLSKDRLKNKISQNEIIVAILKGKIVGVIGIEYIWTTHPYINTLFVDQNHRNQHIASQLLQFLVNYLKSQGFKYLYSSSEETAEVAIKWHLNNGFITCGTLEKINLPDEVKEVFFFKQI